MLILHGTAYENMPNINPKDIRLRKFIEKFSIPD
jgi:hypothetical protein